MNKGMYRVIFSAARGMYVAVQETAGTRTQGAGSASPCTSAVRRRVAGSFLAASAAFAPVGQAQIIADPTAPGNQRPTVLTGPNGAPLVNIQTPSPAGVSHNTYRQFDVNAEGAILNNARSSNPWLAGGTARIILNEVNSHAPSHLRGAIAVQGDRAQVIVANPAGVYADGAHFVNANRVTLTTGNARFENGGLSGFDVRQGTVQIGERGLNTESASYTDILSRSTHIIGRIQAHQGAEVAVTTGANFVDYATGSATASGGVGPTPWLAIDTAAMGGMYAGKITLLATEAGIGVRNAGNLHAAGMLRLSADGKLENAGQMHAPIVSLATAAGDIADYGSLQADRLLLISAGRDFAHSGAGLAQSDAQAPAVVIRAERDVSFLPSSRLSSNGSADRVGAVTVIAGRNLVVGAGNAIEAGGSLQLSAGGKADLTGATVLAAGAEGSIAVRAQHGVQLDNARIQSGGDLTIWSESGDVAGSAITATAGRNMNLMASGGLLSITAEPGVQGNATARVSTLDAGENINLAGKAVYLQATKTRSGGDTSIVANGGSIVLDGVRSAVLNYVPQERVNQLQQALSLTDVAIREASANPDLLSAQDEARAATQGLYSFAQMIRHPGLFEMVNNERARFLNGETTDFLPTQTNLPYYSSLRASAFRLRPHHQRLIQLQAERVQVERQLAILGNPVSGHENRGVDLSANNVSMTAAGGIAVNGAQVRGSGRVELRSTGTLPLAAATSSGEQRNPVGIALAGIVDYYEGGHAGSGRHVWMTAARPSVIEGALGVQIQAVGGNDARVAINSTDLRSSNGTILLQSQGDMRLESGQAESYFYGQHSYKSGGWFNRKSVTETSIDHNMRALPVNLDAQSVHLKSGGSIEAFATQFRAPAGQVQITAAHGLSLYAVPEMQYWQNDVQKRSSFLGIAYDKSKSVDTRRVGSELPAKLVAEGVHTLSGWNTLLHGTVFQTGLGGANINVGVGESARADASIILNGARRIVTESRTVESNQVVWQSQAGSGSTSESLMLPSFNGPTSPLLNGALIAQIPQGDFRTQLELLGRQPGMAYLRTVANTNHVNWHPVRLAFEQWDYKQEGLTGAGAILIALAVTVATHGMGASIVGPSATTSQVVAGGTVTKFTTTGIMANAAFSSIAAQAAVTTVNNGGDIAKTLRMLASTDTVKSALIAAAVAGTVAYTDAWGTTETINGNTLVTDWGQRSQAFLVNTAVKGALTGANKASDWWTIAALSLATEGFKYWVGRAGAIKPGVNSDNPNFDPQQEGGHFRVQRIIVNGQLQDTNNVGLGRICTSAFAICQGMPISNALNVTPGFNSFATLHDTWGNWLNHVKLWNGVTNIGSMPPSLLIAYAHLADQYRYAMPLRR